YPPSARLLVGPPRMPSWALRQAQKFLSIVRHQHCCPGFGLPVYTCSPPSRGTPFLTAALPSYPVGRVLDNRFTDENQREPRAVVGSHRPTLGLAVARIHQFPPGDAGAVWIGQPLAAR